MLLSSWEILQREGHSNLLIFTLEPTNKMSSKSAASPSVQYMSLDEPAPRTSRSRFSSSWWWQELTSVIASFGCMVAVIIILRMVQDKPIDEWTFFVSPT
jgi:hypothetical protein